MMMTDDNQNPSHSNFWDVDGYKRTVKRTEDGLLLCNELMKLMQERAEIEKKYADKIKTWGKRWNEIVDKSPAYGSTREVLKGSLKEAEKLSEAHIIVKDRILNIVSANIADWKAENYKKQLIGCKPAKTFEEEFQRAQKPWAKKLEKVTKAKKDYYNACRMHRVASNQEAESHNRTDLTPDQIKRLQEKMDKCHKEAEVSREKYVRVLAELNSLNGKYMEEMTIVFNKTQDFDRKRIEFFKDILHKFVETLDLSRNQIVTETYQQFHKVVDELDPNSDLRWWSQNYGVDMAVIWPEFEDFVGETVPDRGSKVFGGNGAVPIAASAAVAAAGGGGAMEPSSGSQTLPRGDYQRQPTWEQPPETRETIRPISQPPTQNWNSTEPAVSQVNPFEDETIEDMDNNVNSVAVTAATTTTTAEAAEAAVPPSGTYRGVTVRALYDYAGQEEDELTFKTGEVFTKVQDADDQGWCTGVKDGKIGLYPESYAQPC